MYDTFCYKNGSEIICKKKLQHRVFSVAGATVNIVSSDYMVDESQSFVEVCANLTDITADGLECEVVATINTSDGPKASRSPVYLYASVIWLLKLQLDSSRVSSTRREGGNGGEASTPSSLANPPKRLTVS